MKVMAPAGDYERLVAAIKAGADEVYMGVAGFGARRFAKNFSVDEYVAALDFAHRSNVEVHLTFNTILSDAELDLVYPDIKRLYDAGLDEVIVQDFGVASWLRANFPKLPLCASTQLSPANSDELNWFERQGFARAVLARELSLAEIRRIRRNTSIELEVFASGALCLGCSGKCYLSSFIGGRSGNRGMCAQPCRQYYRAEPDAAALPASPSRSSLRPTPGSTPTPTPTPQAPTGTVLGARPGGEYGYFLSLKDQLQGSAEIAELVEIGVDSIKIEGRMKSPLYVYEVVRYYRDLVDAALGVSKEAAAKRLSTRASDAAASDRSAANPGGKRGALDVKPGKPGDLRKIGGSVVPAFSAKNRPTGPRADVGERSEEERRREIAGLFNRGYDFGYFRENDPKIINEFFASNFGVEIGRVRRDAVKLSAPLRNGDGVVFLDETARKISGLNVGGIRIVDPTNDRRTRLADAAEPGDLVKLDVPVPPDAAFLYRTFDHRLNREIESALKQIRRREPVDARLSAKIGRPLELTLSTPRAAATVRSEQPLEPSQKIGTDAASLVAALDRFGETPFYLRNAKTDFDPNVFVPKSLLNRLRQDAVESLGARIVESYRRTDAPGEPANKSTDESANERTGAPKPVEIAAPNVKKSTSDAPLLTGSALLPYFSAVVRTRPQFDVCRERGVRKIYLETRPIQFENRFSFQESPSAAPLAGSLAEAIRLDGRGKPFSLDWFFNVGNARAVRYLADRFPNADVLFLSPEISDRACAAVVSRLGDYPATRRLTLGLPVYGRLLAMFTQKTLFDAPRVLLTNADDRRLIVEKNADRFGLFVDPTSTRQNGQGGQNEQNGQAQTAQNTATAPTLPTIGSSIYLNEPLNLVDAIPWILRSGIGEVRFDFTTESAADVAKTFDRALAPASSGYTTFSYGYTRDGVF